MTVLKPCVLTKNMLNTYQSHEFITNHYSFVFTHAYMSNIIFISIDHAVYQYIQLD